MSFAAWKVWRVSLAWMGLAAGIGSCPLVGEEGPSADLRASVIVVVGAAGEEEFGEQFRKWADLWLDYASQGNFAVRTIGLDELEETAPQDKDRLREMLVAEDKASRLPLWIVLLGHGTFDGKSAKFNLRGPDVSLAEWAEWLADFQRPVIFLDCASSSGPFLNGLSSTNRVVLTATRSGYEQNFARFGRYLSEVIADPAADLDKDGQTSLLEAYLMASRKVQEFYDAEGRLATEHALLDDTGDGQGTPADWFRGVRVIKKSKDNADPDGWRAHQFHLIPSEAEMALSAETRQRRDRLEMEVFRMRERKSDWEETEYYRKLETILLELAELYAEIEPEEISTIE